VSANSSAISLVPDDPAPTLKADNGFNDGPGQSVSGGPDILTWTNDSTGDHEISVRIGSDGTGQYGISVTCFVNANRDQNGCGVYFEILGVVTNP
jgi:hypothetical protein